MKNVFKMLVENTEGSRILGILQHRWEDNNKTDFKDRGYECGE
jgi:hypothetical protein